MHKNAGVVPPTANNTSGLTPFRRAFNAGDYLTATVPPNSGPDPRLPQINQINSLITVLTNGQNNANGVKAGGAAFSGNPKYVYDSSDYIRFKNLQAKNRNYNDLSHGGDQNNGSFVALMRVRR